MLVTPSDGRVSAHQEIAQHVSVNGPARQLSARHAVEKQEWHKNKQNTGQWWMLKGRTVNV